MGFGSMIFGDPEKRRREKNQSDLDDDYYLRAKAYKEAKTKEKVRLAKIAGKRAAQPKKPFYQKLMGAGQAIMKDLSAPTPGSKSSKRQSMGMGSIFNEKAASDMLTFGPSVVKSKRKRRKKKK